MNLKFLGTIYFFTCLYGAEVEHFSCLYERPHDGKCARYFKVMLHDVGKDSGPATCNDCDQFRIKTLNYERKPLF